MTRQARPPSTAPRIRIEIAYGGCAGWSINHFKAGGSLRYKLTPEAAAVKEEIVIRALNALQWASWTPHPPLKVTIDGRFKDRRHAIDLHNAHKLVLDALQEALGVNDKHMSVGATVPEFGAERPVIIIEVEQR